MVLYITPNLLFLKVHQAIFYVALCLRDIVSTLHDWRCPLYCQILVRRRKNCNHIVSIVIFIYVSTFKRMNGKQFSPWIIIFARGYLLRKFVKVCCYKYVLNGCSIGIIKVYLSNTCLTVKIISLGL